MLSHELKECALVLLKIMMIALMVSMYGCTVYHPQLVDVPLIEKQHELVTDIGISVDPALYGTISYGLTKTIAVQSSGNYLSNERYSFQGAAGFFKAIQKHRVVELYAGYGCGYADISNDANPGKLFGNYHQYFVQTNFGKRGKIEYGFGLRTGLVFSTLTDKNYYRFSNSGPYLPQANTNLVLEPTILCRTGSKKLKFSMKVNGCWMHQIDDRAKLLSYSPLNIGLGLHYRYFSGRAVK